MKATRVKVRPYRHSSTAKFVVSWCTGSRPTKTKIAAWELRNPIANTEDRARYSRGDWQRHRKFFHTREEAEAKADQLRKQLHKEGMAAFEITPALREMAARCAAKLSQSPITAGFTLEHAVDHFIKHMKAVRRSKAAAEVVEEYKAEKARLNKSDRYRADVDFRLRAFVEVFGDRPIETVTTAEMDDWLAGLKLAPQSVNNYRAVVHGLFAYAVKRKYAQENAVTDTAKVKVNDKPPAIFKPEELAGLLEHATADVLPVLVIGAFAGLRMAEIFRLDWSEIDLVRGFVEVKTSKSKTAQRRLVTIHDNARDWLRLCAGRTGKVWPWSASAWLVHLASVKEAAGLADWPQNGLRHSFASYHYAKFRNAHDLALQMGHTSHTLIFQNYRELVWPDVAERYWAIRPTTSVNVVPMEAAVS